MGVILYNTGSIVNCDIDCCYFKCVCFWRYLCISIIMEVTSTLVYNTAKLTIIFSMGGILSYGQMNG